MGLRLSIVTICRNDLVGLQSTLASCRQLPDGVEHVIVDGASTDGTPSFLATLPASRRWLSEPDAGRFDAMNKGAGLARGELLWFMNAGDCFAHAGVLAAVLDDFDQEGWDWAYGLCRLRGKGGEVEGLYGDVVFDRSRFALGGRPIPHQASIVRADFFHSVGSYDCDYGPAADQLWFLKASKTSPPHVIPDILCDFDTSGIGSTRPLWRYFRDMAKARHLVDRDGVGSTVAADAQSAAILGFHYARRGLRRVRTATISGAGR